MSFYQVQNPAREIKKKDTSINHDYLDKHESTYPTYDPIDGTKYNANISFSNVRILDNNYRFQPKPIKTYHRTSPIFKTVEKTNENPLIQSKLKINQLDEPLEREADMVSEKIITSGSNSFIPMIPSTNVNGNELQADGQSSQNRDSYKSFKTSNVIRAEPTFGSELNPQIRKEIEILLHFNLEKVRIHSGGSAASAARELSVRAPLQSGMTFFLEMGNFYLIHMMERSYWLMR